MKSLGIDIGSSSVKVSLLDIASGECAASSANPATEMPIGSPQSGWAEQDPEMWWHYVREGIRQIAVKHPMREVAAIGITMGQIRLSSGLEDTDDLLNDFDQALAKM